MTSLKAIFWLAEFGVLPEIGKAVDDMGWTLPTDVQSEAIPLILGGGDVLMAAETGSGKTGAFCLPVLQIVWESLKDLQEGRVKSGKSGGGGGDTGGGSGWKMSFFDRGQQMAVTPDGLKTQSRHPKVRLQSFSGRFFQPSILALHPLFSITRLYISC